MQQAQALAIFEALSAATRLDVFRLLVQAGPQGMVAGEIAGVLELAPTRLSFHLKSLTACGLLSVEQEGRYLRYRAAMPVMNALMGYLTENCCGGQSQQCQPVSLPGCVNAASTETDSTP